MRPPLTRLAPSPTGALHLGNARTFLITWALARKLGWRILLRIEDLDGPRVKPEAVQGIVSTLSWLGINWDEGPVIQSADWSPYRTAMSSLASRGLAYPCALTRAEIDSAASAPQEGSGESRFPPSLRPADAATARDFGSSAAGTNWRFLLPQSSLVTFTDAVAGSQSLDPAVSIGDFILWTKRDQPSYQLAVVVDDHRQGVTDVVRADDLLDSAARQLMLYRALNLTPEPRHWHLPLVLGPDGKRLAKRHGDSRVDTYRTVGVPRDAVIGLLARWSGVTPMDQPPSPLTPDQFVYAFDVDRLPRTPITFTPEDDAWLRSHAH